jgi:hypothetical protein
MIDERMRGESVVPSGLSAMRLGEITWVRRYKYMVFIKRIDESFSLTINDVEVLAKNNPFWVSTAVNLFPIATLSGLSQLLDVRQQNNVIDEETALTLLTNIEEERGAPENREERFKCALLTSRLKRLKTGKRLKCRLQTGVEIQVERTLDDYVLTTDKGIKIIFPVSCNVGFPKYLANAVYAKKEATIEWFMTLLFTKPQCHFGNGEEKVVRVIDSATLGLFARCVVNGDNPLLVALCGRYYGDATVC